MTLHTMTLHIYMLYDKKQFCCISLVLHRLAITIMLILGSTVNSYCTIGYLRKTIPIFAEKHIFSEIVLPLRRNLKVVCLCYFRSESTYFIKKTVKKI